MGVVRESTRHQVPGWSHGGGGAFLKEMARVCHREVKVQSKVSQKKGGGDISDTPNRKASEGIVNLERVLEKLRTAFLVLPTVSCKASAHPELNPNVTSKAVALVL